MTDYRIRKRADRCTACETPFAEGAVIVSAIYAEGEEFVRRDLCEACFEDAGEVYSHWRGRQPPPPDQSHKLDYDLARQFFDRLRRDGDPAREGLVYTLALLLSRKRRVKIRRTHRLPEGELLEVVVPGPEEDELVQLRAPRVTREEVDRLQAELARLFDLPDDAPGGAPGGTPAQISGSETAPGPAPGPTA